MVTLSEASCRVCLSCPTSLKSMYQLQHHDKDGQELYKELLGTNFLIEARGYPKMICTQCEKIIIAFYDFRQQCTRNEKLLLSYLDSLNVFDGQCMVEAISEDDSGLDTLVDETMGFEQSDLDLLTTEEIDNVVDQLIESSYQPADKLVDLGTTIDDIVQDCSKDPFTIEPMEPKLQDSTPDLLKELDIELPVQPDIQIEEMIEEDPDNESELETEEVEVVPVLMRPANFLNTETVHAEIRGDTTLKEKLSDEEEAIIATIMNNIRSCGKNFRCSICVQTFRTKYDLKRHCFRHFDIYIDKPSCDYCHQRFEKRSQLQYHVEGIHPNEDHRGCGTCGQKFYTLLARRIHQDKHKPKKKWKLKVKECRQCGAHVTRLNDHILREHDNHIYICGLCDGNRQYKRREDLVVHMRTVHLKQKLRSCTHCTQKFASWVSKHNHEIRAHTRNFPFICGKCNYKCCSKNRYDDHMRMHAGEKVYQCPVCLFGFATVSSLKKHFIHHTIRSRYSCKKCGKYFQKKKHLDKHDDKHHTDPHISLCQCPVCPGKPILTITDLNNHFTTKHPDFVMLPSSSP